MVAVSLKKKKKKKNFFDSCSTDGETYVDFVRTGSDCQMDDGQPLMDEEIAYCSDQVAGQACGEVVID